MKKYLMLLVMVVCFTAVNALDKGKWTGFVGDENCGVKGNNKDHAACAVKCVKGGAKPVFVVGDKVYAISNAEKVVGSGQWVLHTYIADAHNRNLNQSQERDIIQIRSK